MRQISTPLTHLLRINVPVVSAPMANASNATLATHVTMGGGFGFIAAGYGEPHSVHKELATARAIFDSRGYPHAFRLPVGIGFLGWKLNEAGEGAFTMIDAALDNDVQAIWLAFGENLGKYVQHIRTRDESTGRKTVVFIQVNSVADALKAVNELKTDVVVAQGIEAGGHGASDSPSVFSLVSSILAALPKDGPPVLPAGGITSGAQIAAFLALGAAGAVLGTRFLLTTESPLSGAQKAALLAADSTSTVRTLAFDHARNTLGWPQGVDGRGLRNKIVQDVEAGVDISTVRERLAEGTKQGLPDYSIIYAGTGVGDVREIKDAQDIVKELWEEMVHRIHETRHLVGDCKIVS